MGMPIYEYRCAACGFQNEYLQKVSEPLLTVCPQCGKDAFKKLLTAAGFQLKGSGWYATDFKGGSTKPAVTKTDGATQSEEKRDTKAAGATQSDEKGDTKAAAPASGAGAEPA
jgi:putative FmdB family regulatory protein